jgi:hypothetical protein
LLDNHDRVSKQEVEKTIERPYDVANHNMRGFLACDQQSERAQRHFADDSGIGRMPTREVVSTTGRQATTGSSRATAAGKIGFPRSPEKL